MRSVISARLGIGRHARYSTFIYNADNIDDFDW
jgi:hypothetical protein